MPLEHEKKSTPAPLNPKAPSPTSDTIRSRAWVVYSSDALQTRAESRLRHPPNSQLSEMGLHYFDLDVMIRLCGVRNVRKNPATLRMPASRKKWRSRAGPSLQE